MRRFMLLIYEDESRGIKPGDPGFTELWDAYVALDEEAKAAGALVDSQPFTPSVVGITLSVRNGAAVVEPGPARPGAYQLTGYYLLNCANEADATAWAAKIPAASSGGLIELREILTP